jgi:cytochrome c oxidase subunit 2
MNALDAFVGKLLQLPPLASEHGADVDKLILYLHYLMILLFIGWSAYFLYALFRFRRSRNPKADYVGTTTHASTWIEVGVAVAEFALLFGMAVPFWARAADRFPDPKNSTVLRVIAQQFNWQARYPGADGEFGKQDIRLVSKQNPLGLLALDAQRKAEDTTGQDDRVSSLNDIAVPVNKPVIAHLTSLDVIHSFKVVPLRVTQDANPGMSIPFHFVPTKTNTYQIQCSQLCGNGHFSMKGFFRVLGQAEYEEWLGAKTTAAAQGAVSYE